MSAINTSGILNISLIEKTLKPNMEEGGNETEFEGYASHKVWGKYGDIYVSEFNEERVATLPVGVYLLVVTPKGFALKNEFKNFTFNYKIYGTETKLIERVKKTYDLSRGNLGMLFNGERGTGKTVTAKQICNKLKLPVIIINSKIENCELFVNSINQDIIVFIDEYEKIFKEESEMLTIMDGAINSIYRRVFILTTNNLYINENMIQRPGRIRYLKTFGNMASNVVEDVVDDLLKHKQFKDDILHFISGLELITIDIVKSIILEVNMHREGPDKFKNVFNVKKLSDKHNIYILADNGKEHILFEGITTNFKNYDPSNMLDVRYNLNFNSIGSFTIVNSIDDNTIEVEFSISDIYGKFHSILKQKLNSIRKKIPTKNGKISLTMRIEKAFNYNKNYKGSYADYNDIL